MTSKLIGKKIKQKDTLDSLLLYINKLFVVYARKCGIFIVF